MLHSFNDIKTQINAYKALVSILEVWAEIHGHDEYNDGDNIVRFSKMKVELTVSCPD